MSNLELLIINAPVGRHFAQLHRDSESCMDSVRQYVEIGLRRGNGVVAIATAANADRLLEMLTRDGLDAEAFRRRGQLALFDAHEMLGRLMKGDMPDWQEFRQSIGRILESVQAFGQTSARVYGEMVDILWRDGRVNAAIRLEEYWNELARHYPFSLFCRYFVDTYDARSYDMPLHEIGRTHSDVIETADDKAFHSVLAAAVRDIFGVSDPEVLHSTNGDGNGSQQLPAAHQAALWILKNDATKLAAVLARARSHQSDSPGAPPRTRPQAG